MTVVVVSDYEAGLKTWKNEVAIVRALARQDIAADFALIIVESIAHRDRPPPKAIQEAFPRSRIVYHASNQSATLKDYGVSLCETDWVAVLEADAEPERSWLRRLMRAAAAHADYDIFSGRTHYGTKSSWQRVLNLLDRSFDDKGSSGPTHHISNNGALYKTEVIKRFRYPDAATPFLSARMRSRTIFEAGHRAYFERTALMRHAIGGFRFVIDFRRNTGFADMMMDRNPGYTKIPGRLAMRMGAELWKICRLHRQYWRWYDWTLGLLMLCFTRVPEASGMVAALRKRDGLAASDYR